MGGGRCPGTELLQTTNSSYSPMRMSLIGLQRETKYWEVPNSLTVVKIL